MPVVPFSSPSAADAAKRGLPPADEPFVLMAAAQMHSEGRLVEPATKVPDRYESRPQASLGGRSMIEANNPELGPSDTELNRRQQEMEAARRRIAK